MVCQCRDDGVVDRSMAERSLRNMVSLGRLVEPICFLAERFCLLSRASAEMGPYVMKDFNTWLPFQTSVMDTALEEDAMESHPIIFPIVSDSQWGDNFGKMTYNKGASGQSRLSS